VSLRSAIEARRSLVAPVAPPKKPVLPLQAAPIKAVAPVAPVAPEKSKSSEVEKVGNENKRLAGTGLGLESRNGELPNSEIWGYQCYQNKPITEQELTKEITRVARHFGLLPAVLWDFLSLEDLEAIQEGTPENIRALWTFAESRSLTGDTTPGGHDLPFPGTIEGGGFKPVCCGDCAHFQPDTIGDGNGIGRCDQGIEPRGGAMYPRVERVCRGHVARSG
jgi:hypothetical protein